MPTGLAFTLYAPLASMGDLAVGERRGGFDRPARSAVLGLVAACLGIDRADEAGHAALDRGYRLAMRLRVAGTLIEDYHTVQAPAADRKARWATRREALGAPALNTLLSWREYRADPAVDVVLIHLGDGPGPDAVAASLQRPAYTRILDGNPVRSVADPATPFAVRDADCAAPERARGDVRDTHAG